MLRFPPITTTAPWSAIRSSGSLARLNKVYPIALSHHDPASGRAARVERGPGLVPAIRVAARRLGRLRLKPADPGRSIVVEGVADPDRGKGHVARAQPARLAVEDRFDL